MDKTPYIPPEVVEWMEKLWPVALPREADSDRSIWIAVGVQTVVRKVKLVSNEQQQNVLQQK